MAIFRAIFDKNGYFQKWFSIKNLIWLYTILWLFCGYFWKYFSIKLYGGYLAILWLLLANLGEFSSVLVSFQQYNLTYWESFDSKK
jgi:hypothetical protein